MTNIISAAVAYRSAIRALASKDAIATVEKNLWKVLYLENKNTGRYFGMDYAGKEESTYRTALKFKAILDIVLNSWIWFEMPTQRAAHMGLHRYGENTHSPIHGEWIFCEENISLEEALVLVHATEKEAVAIQQLWKECGIAADGYVVDPEEGSIPFPMPPTKAVIAWLNEQ